MAKKKVHFIRYHGMTTGKVAGVLHLLELWLVECDSIRIGDWLGTNHLPDVTCGNCKRTKAYKEQKKDE